MTRQDLPSIAEWTSEAFAAASDLNWTSEKMLKHLNDDFRDKYSFVIYDENGLLGGIMAYPCKYDRGDEVFLHTIILKKDQQSKGIGKKFLQWFIGHLKSQKITGIRLDAYQGLPSINWYAQFGFKPSGWEQQLLEIES